jgi:hypothetical protein
VQNFWNDPLINHCELLMVLLHDGTYDKHIDWLAQRECVTYKRIKNLLGLPPPPPYGFCIFFSTALKKSITAYTPAGYCNYRFCPHSAFKCFMLISEQRTIISVYDIKFVCFYNGDRLYLLRGTDWIFEYISVQFQSSKILWHGSGGFSPATHHSCIVCVPGHSMRDFWLTM